MGSLDNLKRGDPAKPFSKENQPSPEAKRAGHAKKRVLKELAESILSGEALDKAKDLVTELGLGIDDEDITIEVMMSLRQVEKAMNDGDTRAYVAVMDRLRGKPKQEVQGTVNINPAGGMSDDQIRAELARLRSINDEEE